MQRNATSDGTVSYMLRLGENFQPRSESTHILGLFLLSPVLFCPPMHF